jgi:hypothetical protein
MLMIAPTIDFVVAVRFSAHAEEEEAELDPLIVTTENYESKKDGLSGIIQDKWQATLFKSTVSALFLLLALPTCPPAHAPACMRCPPLDSTVLRYPIFYASVLCVPACASSTTALPSASWIPT